MATRWTETMDALLKEMVKAAEPMREIAARLGVNRNKAIGRSNRLGLIHPNNNRSRQAEKQERDRQRRQLQWEQAIERARAKEKQKNQSEARRANGNGYAYLKSSKVNGSAVIPVAEANGHEILFSDRTSKQCAFIVGEVKLLETQCCGRPVFRGSWCEGHYRELFTNPKFRA